ncbi:MAG: hemerythrin domain-containing protein [Caldimonas sp.]
MLDDCHRLTLAALDRLEALLAQIERQEIDEVARTVAADIVRHFSQTMRQHHRDEECHVFPALASSADSEVAQTILRLRQDHDWLEEDWMEISPHLDAVACGQSWYDIDVLREGVAIFAGLSRDHITLEESILYPQARTRLGTGARREMGREMAARRRQASGSRRKAG